MLKMSFCTNANKSVWVDRIYAHNRFFDASFWKAQKRVSILLNYLENCIFKRTMDLQTYLQTKLFSVF